MSEKYPSGAINQHKALATGGSLQKADTKNLDPTGWGPSNKGKIYKSGTSTGTSKK